LVQVQEEAPGAGLREQLRSLVFIAPDKRVKNALTWGTVAE
jgi:hypothetical protein